MLSWSLFLLTVARGLLPVCVALDAAFWSSSRSRAGAAGTASCQHILALALRCKQAELAFLYLWALPGPRNLLCWECQGMNAHPSPQQPLPNGR